MSQAMNLADLRRPSPKNPNPLTLPAEAQPNHDRQYMPPAQVSASPMAKVSFETIAGFEMLQRIGAMFSSSSLIPDGYRGQLSNCIIVCELAFRLGINPLTMMQHTYIVHGKPAMTSSLLIATFNACGRYSSIKYEFCGQQGQDSWGCRAICRELATNEMLAGPWVTIGMAKKDGWYGKAGSKWQSMPELMLRYRAATFLIRTTAPEISLGLQTVEEVHDVYDPAPRQTTAYVSQPKQDMEQVPEEPQADAELKPKRHRRTKAEMEAARAQEAAEAEAAKTPPATEQICENLNEKATAPVMPTAAPESAKNSDFVENQPGSLAEAVLEPEASTPPWEGLPLSAQIDEICADHMINRHAFDYVVQNYADATGKPVEEGQRYFIEHPDQIMNRYNQLKAQGNVNA